jgi:hypothetical protein
MTQSSFSEVFEIAATRISLEQGIAVEHALLIVVQHSHGIGVTPDDTSCLRHFKNVRAARLG